MANVTDYTTGKVVADIKQALSLLDSMKGSISGSEIGKRLLKEVEKFEPKLIDIKKASQLIQESEKCAVGERVCRAIHKDSEFTESVFLDELAEGMVEAGKAKYVTKEDAINSLKKYPKNPLTLSKVSGKYMEICRSWPKNCIYWNMEKCGLKCLSGDWEQHSMGDETIAKEPTSKVVIRFQDCDPFGHLNSARYIDYFINAREDHLAQYYDFDIYKRQKELNENWVVTKHQIAYISPVFFREEVVIKTCLLRFTETSLLMEGVMLDKDAKHIKSVIWTEFKYFSLTNGKLVKHSGELMQFFERISIGNRAIKINDFDPRVKEIKFQFR